MPQMKPSCGSVSCKYYFLHNDVLSYILIFLYYNGLFIHYLYHTPHPPLRGPPSPRGEGFFLVLIHPLLLLSSYSLILLFPTGTGPAGSIGVSLRFKTIKRAACMPRSYMYHSKAKTDYPNRFLSDAQVCPVSSGHTLASVRSVDTYRDDVHTLRAMTGFKPERYSGCPSSRTVPLLI